MTYTKKMHESARRQTAGKHNIVTDLLDEIEQLQKQVAEMKKIESADFWCNWVYPERATAEQVQNELEDYHVILDNVCIVYDHITGGRISKANTLAHEVTSVADDYYRDLYEEEVEYT